VLDEDTRTAILRLHAQSHGSRRIARALGVARASVRCIISSGSATVPPLVRAELAEPWREQILELHARYEGHLGRVHDALTELGAAVSYPALTAFCRRHGIGSAPPPPAGHYLFAPGAEMQHDTSPHQARIGSNLTRRHCMRSAQGTQARFVPDLSSLPEVWCVELTPLAQYEALNDSYVGEAA